MSITLSQLQEVIENTRELVRPGSYEDISRTRKRYVAAKQLLKRRKKQARGAGHGFRWQVKVNRHQQARFVGAFEVEQVAVRDMFVHANVPMRACSTKYAFDVMEQELNSGPEQLVEIVKARRDDAVGDVLDLIEESFWASSITYGDELTAWPIRHTILPHGTAGIGTDGATTAAGFTAQNPGGWSDKQGLSGASYTRWNNWTAGWAQMSDIAPGFVYRVNEAIDKTKFEAPVPYPGMGPEDNDYAFFTCYSLRSQINQWLRRQNDNIGRDLRNFFGDPLLNGVPVMWIEDLDGDATLPFIGLNWNVIEVLQGSGWWLKEFGPDRAPMQPTAMECFFYYMYNIINRDPSRNFQINYYANLSGNGLT